MTENKSSIAEILSTLTPREERVLRMHYGLGWDKALSLEEIGAEFNVTADRIGQIVNKALKKTEEPAKALGYASFEDYVKGMKK